MFVCYKVTYICTYISDYLKSIKILIERINHCCGGYIELGNCIHFCRVTQLIG